MPSPDPQVTDDAVSGLFVVPVAVCVATADFYDAPLHPSEQAHVAGAIEKRRAEFAAGRSAARAALRILGAPAGALPARPDRTVDWPPLALGSITHCDTACCSVVAWRTDAAGLGLDAEVNVPLPAGVADLVLTPRERRVAGTQRFAPPEVLSFSAKEAFFKCYFPLARQFLDFQDVSAAFSADEDGVSGSFGVRFEKLGRALSHLAPDFIGRWRMTAATVLTAVTLRADMVG